MGFLPGCLQKYFAAFHQDSSIIPSLIHRGIPFYFYIDYFRVGHFSQYSFRDSLKYCFRYFWTRIPSGNPHGCPSWIPFRFLSRNPSLSPPGISSLILPDFPYGIFVVILSGILSMGFSLGISPRIPYDIILGILKFHLGYPLAISPDFFTEFF